MLNFLKVVYCLTLPLFLIGCDTTSPEENTVSNEQIESPPALEPILLSKNFESTDSINDWAFFNHSIATLDQTESFNGTSSLLITDPQSNSPYTTTELIERISVENGKQYEISFAIKLEGGEGFSNYWDFWVLIPDSENILSLIDHGFNKDSQPFSMDWFKQKYYFLANKTELVTLKFFSSANSTWIDDVEIKEITSPKEFEPLTFDFESENSLATFNLFPKQSIGLDTENSFNGTYSLYMSNNGSGATVEIIDGINVEANTTYEVSAAIKLQGDGFPYYWDFYVDALQANDNIAIGDSNANGINGLTSPVDIDWNIYTFTITTKNNLPVKLIFNSNTTHAWLDDISIRKAD